MTLLQLSAGSRASLCLEDELALVRLHALLADSKASNVRPCLYLASCRIFASTGLGSPCAAALVVVRVIPAPGPVPVLVPAAPGPTLRLVLQEVVQDVLSPIETNSLHFRSDRRLDMFDVESFALTNVAEPLVN